MNYWVCGVLILECLFTIIYFRRIGKVNRESLQMLLDKVSELGARQMILEAKMGYEVTSIEISKQSKH